MKSFFPSPRPHLLATPGYAANTTKAPGTGTKFKTALAA